MKTACFAGAVVAAILLAACGEPSPAAEDTHVANGASPTATAVPATRGTESSATPASPTQGPSSLSAGATGDRGPAEHVGARTMAHIRELSSSIGARVSGTDGEKKATDYIADRFRDAGYAVEVTEFEIAGFGPADVRIDGDARAVDALALSGSGARPADGKAVFIGLGDSAGIGGRNLTGSVAIALRGSLRFAEKYENARSAGAAALVIVNTQPGLFSGSLGSQAGFPVIGVGSEDESRLRAAAEAGARIRVVPAATTRALNVIARAAAGEPCGIVVGGHHDTVPGVPGATDNASGTAHTLELARAFAADGLDRGLCFVTFGGEESGLHGSRALVAKWTAEGTLPAYMVNLDVTATGTVVELIGAADLQSLATAIAVRQGLAARESSLPPNTGSDHQSFANAGVPVIFLAGDDYSDIHTLRDTIDRISENLVEGLGDLAYELIRQLQARVAPP